MKKITILMLHLLHGGIEKQIVTFANELVKKYEVQIISTYSMKHEPAYEVDEKVKIKYLIDDKPNRDEFKAAIKSKNIINILKEGFKSVKILWLKRKLMIHEIKRLDCDFVLSTRVEFADWLSGYAPDNITTLTQEHLHDDSPEYIKKCQKAFRNLDYLMVLCEGSRKNFTRWLSENKKIRIVEIPNILEKVSDEKASLDGYNLISVGRLHPVKNFASLIRVFKLVSEKLPSAKLTIAGGGDEAEMLLKTAKELGLEDKINFTGMISKEQVEEHMLNSDVYVMTSLTECFPMVLLEAESVGLPLVSYDVPVGPAAIISEGFNGLLIPFGDEQKMAEAVIKILENTSLKSQLSINAKKDSYRYLPERVMPMWYEIFDNEI